jgi:uncharacterized protein YbcI
MIKRIKSIFDTNNILDFIRNRILLDENHHIRLYFIKKICKEREYINNKIMESKFIDIFKDFSVHQDYRFR